MTDELFDELNDYRIQTFLYAYVYSTDINSIFESSKEIEDNVNVLYNEKFLEKLKIFVKDNIKYEYINEDAKRNIYDLLMFIRQYYIKKDKSKIDDINECIIDMNTAIDSMGYEDFVKSEIRKRVYNKKVFDNSNIKPNYNLFPRLYLYDIETINTLTLDEENFRINSKNLVINEFYFLSINRLCEEIPNFIEDDTAYVRSLAVLKVNKMKFLKEPMRIIEHPSFLVKNHNTIKTLVKTKRKITNNN